MVIDLHSRKIRAIITLIFCFVIVPSIDLLAGLPTVVYLFMGMPFGWWTAKGE